ncbi:MAG: hypothetical protein AB7S41_04290 [Parvibaculaceae bacterium]
MSILRALFLVLPFLFLAPASAAEAPKGAVIFTIAGAVGETNRGPYSEFDDGFLKHHERSFEKAFAFDRAMLEALPQQEITAKAEGWAKAYRLKGPLVTDVLKLVGAEGRTVTFVALDGYATKFTPEEIAAHRWVLAHTGDGVPLAIGGRGPLWMAYDVEGGSASWEEEGRWAWAVFYAEVE